MPVMAGTAVARLRTGSTDWSTFAAALVGAVLVHAGANLLNEHGDHLSGADASNPAHTLLSGGSGVIQEGLLSPRAVAVGAGACLLGGGLLGVYLNAVTPGNVVLVIGVLGVALGWAYSERPLRLGYRGHGGGEASVAIAFGPLPVLGACYVQLGELNAGAVAASIPIALLIALVLTVNGFPDLGPDRAAGKRTLVVTLGPRLTSGLCHALFAAVYALTISLVAGGLLPAPTLLTLATAPVAWMALSALRRRALSGFSPPGASALTVATHTSYCALLTLGLLLSGAA